MSRSEAIKWGVIFLVIAVICALYYYMTPQNDTSRVSTISNEVATTTSKRTQEHIPDTAFGITNGMKGDTVSIQANVVSMSSGKGHSFPVLKDPQNQKTIKGVLFKKDSEEDSSRKNLLEERRINGELVSIEGIVDIYEGELEIIIKKVY